MAYFKRFTRYTNGLTYVNRSSQTFLILRPPLNLPSASSDVYVTISQDIANRPDLISQKAYGTPDLWWVIYEYNNIVDPLFDLQVGQIIKIPDKNRVVTAIQQLNRV